MTVRKSVSVKNFVGVDSGYKRPDGTEITHDEMFGAVVDAIGLNALVSVVPIESQEEAAALYGEDKHFNNVPIKKWDDRHDYVKSLMVRAGINSISLSDTVCVLKCAARRWALGEQATTKPAKKPLPPRVVFSFGSWRVMTGGMGSFMNPPGEAHHMFEVRDGFGNNASHYSLNGALHNEDTPEEVKQAIRQIKADHPGDVKNEKWIRSVYSYFRSAYTKDPADRNVNSDNCVFVGKWWNRTIADLRNMGITPEHSLGYLLVKSFDPEHKVRMDLLEPEWKEGETDGCPSHEG